VNRDFIMVFEIKEISLLSKVCILGVLTLIALLPTVACMKRWGLRAAFLSADTNANAGQNA
jgi:hypothetical protein